MIRAWLSPVLALLAMLGVLLMFHGTVADVVKVWNQSGTYTHGYFVLPIAFWLIWRERAEILQAGFRPGWLAIPAMLASAGLWLAGDLAGVSVVTHFGLAFMLMCCIWAAFGNAAARRAWFGIPLRVRPGNPRDARGRLSFPADSELMVSDGDMLAEGETWPEKEIKKKMKGGAKGKGGPTPGWEMATRSDHV